MNKIFFSLFLLALLLFVSCSQNNRGSLPSQDSRLETQLQEQEADANPINFSFSESLSKASLVKVSQYHPENPFPELVSLSGSNLELVYGSLRIPILKTTDPEGAEDLELRYELGSRELYKSARRGELIYERKAHYLVLYSQNIDTGDTTELGRYVSKAMLVAGPVAFQDALLLATDAPSFIALDRKTLSVIFEREIESLLSGPLIPLFSQQLLYAHRSDGDISFYSLKDNSSAEKEFNLEKDPVDNFLHGEGPSFRIINQRCAQLLGEGEDFQFKAIHPYLPRTELDIEGPVLFRLDAENTATMKFYVQGTKQPYLIAVFDSKGNELSSNIEYSAEEVITSRLTQGSVYYIAAALLGSPEGKDSVEGASATDAPPQTPRLVIAPK